MNVFQIIEQFDTIAIFRHIRPDFDAYGSQFGLGRIIEDLYPYKRVVYYGEMVEDMLAQMQIDLSSQIELKQDEIKNALAIVLDTANKERIDGEVFANNNEGDSLYKQVIKIDHHIVIDSYGHVNVEDDSSSSACQIVAELAEKYLPINISKKASEYLYLGMVTDSNRFLYNKTSPATFKAAAYLLSCGCEYVPLYNALYVQEEKELQVRRYILNLYQKYGNILYYILKQTDLDAMNISRSKGSDYVNLLSNINGYPIWVAITENTEENNYRVSIRSRNIAINEVANKYHGGGHANASGCRLDTIDELPALLQDLQEVYNQNPD